jgi:hypothetical protein
MELLARLRAATVEAQPAPRAASRRAAPRAQWVTLWRGLLLAGPAAAVVLLLWFAWQPAPRPARPAMPAAAGINPRSVSVGHSLLASFDTVAQVPGGAPVRFRCREWRDDVVIHDGAHGMVVSQSIPRVELIPLRFETY